MSGGSKVVKLTAKTALKGNWLNSIIASAVFLFCCFICNYSAGIFSYTGIYSVSYIILLLLSVFLLVPLFLGLLRYTWRLLFGCCDNPLAVFYYLSEKSLYKRAMQLTLKLALKAIPPALILYLPVFLLWFFTQSYFYDIIDVAMPLWVANTNSLLIILQVFATVALIFYMLKFYISPILFIADENMDISEAVYMSNIISRKSALDFIYLFSSFIGWILLSFLVIPLIFTLPYMITSYAVHTRFAVAEYNKHITESVSFRGF